MKTMFQRSSLLAAVLAACVLAACSPMKDPAEAALADANSVMQKVAPDAQKYAPAEYAALSEQVAGMKAAFDRKDYNAVLNTVSKLAPNLKMLAQIVANKKHEALIANKEQWAGMSGDVPKSLTAAEARVAELNKTHRLPKGVTKEALAGAGAALDAAKQGWSEAQGAATSGNVEDAVVKGKAAQAKLAELMASLAAHAPGAVAK
jgi:hypothetical protein